MKKVIVSFFIFLLFLPQLLQFGHNFFHDHHHDHNHVHIGSTDQTLQTPESICTFCLIFRSATDFDYYYSILYSFIITMLTVGLVFSKSFQKNFGVINFNSRAPPIKV